MNGIDYLADTNALIYLLAGNECMRPYLDKRFAVSVISYMEILSFSGIKADEQLPFICLVFLFIFIFEIKKWRHPKIGCLQSFFTSD